MSTKCTSPQISYMISTIVLLMSICHNSIATCRCLFNHISKLKVVYMYLFCINISSASDLFYDIQWSLDIYHHNLISDITFETSNNQNTMQIPVDHPIFNSNINEQTRRTLLTRSDRLDVRNHLNNKRSFIAQNGINTSEQPAPTASNMNFLFWNTAAEAVSQSFTDECANKPIENLITKFIGSHDHYFQKNPTDYFDLGTVVSVASLTVINPTNSGSGSTYLKSMVDLFYDSYKNDYYYDKYDSTVGLDTDPFVWLNWGNLRYFGCAMTTCGPPSVDDNWPTTAEYADGGILMNCLLYKSYENNEYPWKNGSVCTDCDSDKNVCNNGLCGNCMTSDWYVNGDLSNNKGDKCTNLGDDYKIYTPSPTAAPTEIHREYTLVPKQMTWSEANNYCVNIYGSNLATIITESDYQQAVNVQGTVGNGLDVWIGLNEVNGEWTWAGGSSCNYTLDGNCVSDIHWGPYEPNNVLQNNGAFEDCAHIFGDNWDGKNNSYNDAECDLKMYFLCDCVEQLDGSYHCPTGTPTPEPTNAPTIFEIPRKYIYVNKKLTWIEAEDYCERRYGTNLATIVTDGDHMEAVVMQHSYNGYGSDIWIGLNENDNPGTWAWADGTECDYTTDHLCASDAHWAAGEPNGAWERCAAMFGDHWHENNNYYNDYTCVKEFSFLCNCEKQYNGSYICPTATPTTQPTYEPTYSPTKTTMHPTSIPTNNPTAEPTTNPVTNKPTIQPTNIPTSNPTHNPTTDPTNIPTIYPTYVPTIMPSIYPTNHPTVYPTIYPTRLPSINPTRLPSINPTLRPTINPTFLPTFLPTNNPTTIPSNYPSNKPTINPTVYPSKNPSLFPTNDPTIQPTNIPTIYPSVYPTEYPTAQPTEYPSIYPTAQPTQYPTAQPTQYPTLTDIKTSIIDADSMINKGAGTGGNGVDITVSTSISTWQLLIILLCLICLICCGCLVCILYLRRWKRKAMQKYEGNIVNMTVAHKSPTSQNSPVTANDTPVSVASVCNILHEMNEGDEQTVDVTVLNTPVITRPSAQLQSIFNDIMEQDTANNMNVRNQLENIHYDKSTKTTDCALNMITENCDEKSSDDEVVINMQKENICNGNEYDGNLTGNTLNCHNASHVVIPSNQQRPSMLDKLI